MTEQTAIAILNEYPSKEYNVLAPQTVTQVTPWHQITVTEVRLSANKDDGDVYPQSGRFALTKIACLKLADAAGVRFQPTRFQRYPEDGSYEAYVVAEKQDPDGSWRQFPGSYFWDVTQRLSDIAEPDSYKGKSETRMIRTFAMQRAETGAILRAIRNIIKVQATYTYDELQKPFIVARVSFNPFNDAEIREAYRQALLTRLTRNTALLRGDFDEEDPLGIDSHHQSTMPTPAQLQAATDTLQLLGADHPQNGSSHDPECNLTTLGDAREEGEFETGEERPNVEAEPEPPATRKSNGRPLTAEQILAVCRKKANWFENGTRRNVAGEPVSEKQVKFVVSLLTSALESMPSNLQDKARHDVLDYLYGVDSTSKLMRAEASAIIDWLKDPADGSYKCNEYATTEMARIIEAVAVANGQLGMEL